MQALGRVTFDSGSFRATGPGQGAINATVVTRAGSTRHWTVTLVIENGRWKIADTASKTSP
jgi:hypothetical protein